MKSFLGWILLSKLLWEIIISESFNKHDCWIIYLCLILSVGWSSSRLERLIAATRSYAKLGADLVTFFLGLVQGAYPAYTRKVPDEQTSVATTYINALRSPRKDIQKSIQRHLQKLLYVLFTEEASTMNGRYRSTVYRFLIVYSFRKEGNIDYCGTITQHISKLVFFGRCAIYQRIQQEMEKRGNIGFFS